MAHVDLKAAECVVENANAEAQRKRRLRLSIIIQVMASYPLLALHTEYSRTIRSPIPCRIRSLLEKRTYPIQYSTLRQELGHVRHEAKSIPVFWVELNHPKR